VFLILSLWLVGACLLNNTDIKEKTLAMEPEVPSTSANEEIDLSFSELSLNEKILLALDNNGFHEPTPVQKASIPEIIAKRDILASAKTGSGKTAAFILPTLQNLLTRQNEHNASPRVLILTPTRELATQIKNCIYQFSKNIDLKYGVIVGGTPYPPQIKLLDQNLDILVGTPGRLLDHLDAGRLDLSKLEVLILDEADRMLDMGFQEAIQRLTNQTPSSRQTLLFSATLQNKSVVAEANRLLSNPVRIEVDCIKQEHSQIQQSIHFTRNINHKKELLNRLFDNNETKLAIIFTATKRCADDLAKEMRNLGYRCAALHGDMSQAARNRTVERFKKRQIQFLFATDVAARGIDIQDISHVINFDLPKNPEDYIHRIGRTGRAGKSGIAISLVGRPDKGVLRRIEQLIGQKLQVRDIPVPKSEYSLELEADKNTKSQTEQATNCSGYMRSRTRRGHNKDYQGSNTSSGTSKEKTSINKKNKPNTSSKTNENKHDKRAKPHNKAQGNLSQTNKNQSSTHKNKTYQDNSTPFGYKGDQGNIKPNFVMSGIGNHALRERDAQRVNAKLYSNEAGDPQKSNKTVIKHQVRNKKITTTKKLNINDSKVINVDNPRIEGRISLKKKISSQDNNIPETELNSLD